MLQPSRLSRSLKTLDMPALALSHSVLHLSKHMGVGLGASSRPQTAVNCVLPIFAREMAPARDGVEGVIKGLSLSEKVRSMIGQLCEQSPRGAATGDAPKLAAAAHRVPLTARHNTRRRRPA